MAIADAGRTGEIRYIGEIANTPEATRKLVAKLAAKYDELHFCYEAGPTGYGLHRCLKNLGQDCIVIAPTSMPRRPGDRVKTNRRDAMDLARLLRAGELTPIWVPDAPHEAMRDLVRAREAAVRDSRMKRQQVSAMMLRHGRIYPGKKTGAQNIAAGSPIRISATAHPTSRWAKRCRLWRMRRRGNSEPRQRARPCSRNGRSLLSSRRCRRCAG